MISEVYSRLKAVLTRLRILPLGISTILLIVNLLVLALPLGSIIFFRLYENQLVRETEAELIAQSAFIAEIYKREIRSQLLSSGEPDTFGLVLAEPHQRAIDEYYTPQKTRLDLASDTMLPARPDGIVTNGRADPRAQSAGQAIRPVLDNAKRTTLAGMRVLDHNGIAVSGGNEIGLSFAHVPEVDAAMRGRYASVIRKRYSDEPRPDFSSISRGTGIRIFTAYPIVVDDRLWGVAYLSRTPKSILKYLYDDRAKLGLAVISIVLLTLLIALLTSWTIARPIYRLVDRTQRIAAGDRTALNADVGGTKEIALLSDSFTTMATELEARSDYIKQFATHVSHEFKTPLASIRGAAELLEDHTDSMSKAERARFVHNIIADAERMKQLVNRLLQLARADNPESTAGRTDLVAFLRRLCASKSRDGLALDLQTELAAPLWVPMSDEALQMILSNLFSNAREHRATRVDVRLWQEGDTAKFSCRDNGEGISPANRERIFEPFFTTRREQGGTGLGLGIIKSVLQTHGGSVQLDGEKGGTCFVISLPIVQQ